MTTLHRHLLRVAALTLPLSGLSLAAETASEPDAETLLLYESWRWVRFTSESGLPSDRVFDVVETPSGTPWASTDAGPAWFDGFAWHHAGGELGIPEVRPTSISTVGESEVLVVTEAHLYRGDARGFRRVLADRPELLVHNAVQMDRDRVLLLVEKATTGVAELREYREAADGTGTLLPIQIPDALDWPIEKPLWQTGDQGCWLATRDGLYRRVDDTWALKFDEPVSSVTQIGVAGQYGLLHIHTPDEARGVWSWNDTRDDGALRFATQFRQRAVLSMDVRANGEAIVVFDAGDVHYRIDDAWSLLSPTPAELQSVTRVRFRPNGDLWVGTHRGLHLHRRSVGHWSTWPHGQVELTNEVLEYLHARDGSIWIGNGAGVEVRRPDGSVQRWEQFGDVQLVAITGLAEDDEGRIWVSSGSQFPGAYRWDGETWTHVGPADGLAAPAVHRIRRDRRGRLWFLGLGTNRADLALHNPGAFVWDGERFERWSTAEGLLGDRVFSFGDAPDGTLWFGTLDGLSRWRDGTWTHWTVETGLLHDKVWALTVDDEGRPWFGHQVAGGGLGTVDEHDRVRYFTIADGLINANIWDLRCDAAGRLWIATEGGLNVLNDDTWTTFTSDLGLTNPRILAVLPLEHAVYAGTMGSGTRILDLAEAGRHPPRVLFQREMVQNDTALVRWVATPYWGRMASKHVLTRHRMDGSPWSEWSLEREVLHGDLGYGDHEFEVEALGFFGHVGPEPGRLTLTVVKPLHLRPVFLVPLVAVFAGLLWVTGLLAVRRYRQGQALRRSEELFREQAAANHMLYRELDHRVRNNLTSLLALIEMTRRSTHDVLSFESAISGRVQAMARVHTMLSQAKWMPVSFQQLVRALLPSATSSTGSLHFHGPDIAIPARQVGALGMVMHELLTNSAKHGALSGAHGSITVSTRWLDDGRMRWRWEERGGPPIRTDLKPGVGTGLIEGFIRSELGGRADLHYATAGVEHEFTVVLDVDATQPPLRHRQNRGSDA